MSKAEDIARELQRAIDGGDHAPGGMLPSIPELAMAHQVSEPTARAALGLLVHWGVAIAHQGRGYLVPPRRPTINRRPQDRYAHEKRRARSIDMGQEGGHVGALEFDAGMPPEQLRLMRAEFQRVELPADLALRFGVAAGTDALHRFYVVGFDIDGADVPQMLTHSWLLMSHIRGNPELLDPELEPWDGGTMHQLRTVGIEVDHALDEHTARRPMGVEPDLLQMSPGAIVMAMTKILVAVGGHVVEVSTSVVPADGLTLSYRVDLDRWPVHNDEVHWTATMMADRERQRASGAPDRVVPGLVIRPEE